MTTTTHDPPKRQPPPYSSCNSAVSSKNGQVKRSGSCEFSQLTSNLYFQKTVEVAADVAADARLSTGTSIVEPRDTETCATEYDEGDYDFDVPMTDGELDEDETVLLPTPEQWEQGIRWCKGAGVFNHDYYLITSKRICMRKGFCQRWFIKIRTEDVMHLSLVQSCFRWKDRGVITFTSLDPRYPIIKARVYFSNWYFEKLVESMTNAKTAMDESELGDSARSGAHSRPWRAVVPRSDDWNKSIPYNCLQCCCMTKMKYVVIHDQDRIPQCVCHEATMCCCCTKRTAIHLKEVYNVELKQYCWSFWCCCHILTCNRCPRGSGILALSALGRSHDIGVRDAEFTFAEMHRAVAPRDAIDNAFHFRRHRSLIVASDGR